MLQYKGSNTEKERASKMKVFISKKDNVTKLELINEQDGKCEVKFLNGSKEGETATYSFGTIKRWWKEAEEPTKERQLVPVPGAEKLGILKKECPRKGSSKKIDRTEEISEIDTFIRNNYENKWYPSVKCYKIMKGKKPVAEVYPQRKKILCYFHSLEGKNLDKTLFHKDGYKYYLPARVDISYDSDFISILSELLKEN